MMQRIFLSKIGLILACLGGIVVFCGAAEIPLPGPTDSIQITCSDITLHSVRLQWQAINLATRYEVSFGTDALASNRNSFFINQNDTLLTSLQPSTIYYAKLRPILSGQAGAWSPTQEFSTLIPIFSEFTVDDIRNDALHFSWKNLYADLAYNHYELSWSLDPTTTATAVHSTQTNNLWLNKLTPNTKYFIRLRACNPKTSGPWSEPLAVTTLLYAPNLAPQGLFFRLQNNYSIQVEWDSVTHAAGYDLSYGTDALGENIGKIPVEKNQCLLQLSPHTRYFFKVRSLLWNIPSRWSSIQSCVTLPPKPRNVNLSAQTSSQVIIGWEALPDSDLPHSYSISWGSQSSASNLGSAVSQVPSFTLTGLQADKHYTVQVRILNESGPGPWSDPLALVTLPMSLRQVKAEAIQQTSALIRWSEHARAQAYELSYGSDAEAINKSQEEIRRPPAQLRNLIPDLTYYVKVRPILENRTFGPWSEIISFQTFAPLPAPKVPVITEIGSSYVLLSWSPVALANNYELYLTSESEMENERTQLTAHNSLRMTGLHSNSTYSIKVRALNVGGSSEWSDLISFTTAPDSAPANLRVSNITANETSVHWDALPGSAQPLYHIHYAAANEPWILVTDYPNRVFHLTDLRPATVYRVQIQAYNSSGLGPWSPDIHWKTLLEPPRAAPENLQVDTITDISAQVSWQFVPQAKGYLLSLGTDLAASDRGIKEVKENSLILKGLNPDTSYFVKVKVFNSSGESPWSDSILITTRPLPPLLAPTGVQISDISSTALTLVWTPASGILNYEVSLGTDPQGENSGQPQATDFPSFTFHGLKTNTTYQVKVRSINRGGPGPWSQIQSAHCGE